MKVRCFKCKEAAILTPDFTRIYCESCGLDMSYGEYVRQVAHADSTYSDILGDYAGSVEAKSASTDDSWD